MSIVDRAAHKAAVMRKFRNPEQAPMPGLVKMTCTECNSFILWVNPPLPPNGRTICKECE
jgi:hypothetical protein